MPLSAAATSPADPTHPVWPRWGWPALALAALVCVGAAAARLFAADEALLVTGFVCDDAYYFTQWARHVARGNGPSFDGFEFTDGVRPIWALSLVPIYALVEDGPLAVRLAGVWGALVQALAFALLARALARALRPGAAVLAGVLGMLVPTFGGLGAGVMDWPMNLLLMVALVVCAAAVAKRTGATWPAFGLGVLGALNLLQRPETLPLVAGIGVLLAREWGTRAGAGRAWGWLLVGGAAVLVPFAAASFALFGAFGSVAGGLKTRLAFELWSPAVAAEAFAVVLAQSPGDLLFDLGVPDAWTARGSGPWVGLAWTAGLAALALLLARSRAGEGNGAAGGAASGDARRVRLFVIWPLLLYGLVHSATLANLLFPFLAYGRWYFGPQDLALVVLFALGAHGLLRRSPAPAARALAAGVLAALVAAQARQGIGPPGTPIEGHRVLLEAAEWLATEVSRDTRVGAHNAGVLAYYAVQPVTNLDGLMNTHAFARECLLEPDPEQRRANLLRYLVERDIRLLADPWPREYEHHLPAIYFGEPARPFFRLEVALPMEGRPDESYQIYRLDTDALRALLR